MTEAAELIVKAKVELKNEPLDYIVQTIQQAHFGDTDVLKTLVLSAITAHPYFNTKLHVAMTGISDEGKTDAGLKTLSVMPTKYQYETHKVSPKALYYEAREGYSFYNKVIFLDDVTDNDTEILKNIANSSSKPPSFTTLINQVPTRINFDYAPVVWTTRVDLIEDYQGQADRRFYTVEVKSNNSRVLQHIAETECNNIEPEESEDWHISRTMMDIVMKANIVVKVPSFDYTVAKTKSGLKFLIAMIKAIAKINALRNETEDNQIVIASEEDIKEGTMLYQNNYAQQMKLSTKAIKLLEHVIDVMPTEADFNHPEISPHTVEAIHADVKDIMSIAEARKWLKSLYNKGIINALTGQRNRQFYYKM